VEAEFILSSKEVYKLVYNDLIAFGKLFLPEDFADKNKTPEFHKEISGYLSEDNIKRFAAILPRGFGKSTLMKANILRALLFSTKENPEFIAWISESQDQAKDNLKYIARHLEENKYIKHYFGDLTGGKWTQDEIVLKNGARLLARGAGQRIRGRTEMHMRFTKIVLDDFESELNTKTPEARVAIKSWVMAAVLPALEPETGRLFAVGTIVHWDSFLQNIVDAYHKEGLSSGWFLVFHKAIENNESIWADRFSIDKINEIKSAYKSLGQPGKFYQEYMNEAVSPEEQRFKDSMFKYHNVSLKFTEYGEKYIEINNEKRKVTVFVGVDPATAVDKSTSDFTVILVGALDTEGNFYVLEYTRERSLPVFAKEGEKNIIDELFRYYDIYNPDDFIIETVQFQETILQGLNVEMGKRNKWLSYRQEKPRTSKDSRILSMIPRFVTGHVYFRNTMDDLEHELKTFPKGSHDDTLDALYYAMTYSYPPNDNIFFDAAKAKKEKFGEINWLAL
jgi:predicted phage terminase large subunit-like protein